MENKIEVLLDDRDCSIGKKLSDNELIGIPLQIIIGKRNLKDGLVEIKDRTNNEIDKIEVDEVINFIDAKLQL